MSKNPKYYLKPGQKSKVLMFLVFSFLFCQSLSSQSISWQRTYDGPFQWTDISEDICDAGNGNFFIVGTTKRPNSYSSIFLLKIDKFGDTLWTKYIDTAAGKSLTPSGDGGCVITGLKGSAFTTKIDSNGNTVWFKKYTGNIVFVGYDIIKTVDNGYLVCGSVYYDSAYVLKLDSLGDIQWQKTHSSGSRKGYREIISGINGGYVLIGFMDNNPNDTTRGVITQIDSLGNIYRERIFTIGGNTGITNIEKSDNEYILSGDVYDGNNFRVFMKRIDIEFNDIFTKVFISDDDESTARIKSINNNRYVMSMSRLTNSFPMTYYTKLIITDSIGSILNQKYYNAPGDLDIYSIFPQNNGDILFVGYAEYFSFPIKEDVYALRTDSLLNAPPPIGIYQVNEIIPITFSLYQNYPNPFNPETQIKFDVPKSANIKIAVYDMLGREVAILVNGKMDPGVYNASWNATPYASGVYFYRLTSDDFVSVKKMIVIK